MTDVAAYMMIKFCKLKFICYSIEGGVILICQWYAHADWGGGGGPGLVLVKALDTEFHLVHFGGRLVRDRGCYRQCVQAHRFPRDKCQQGVLSDLVAAQRNHITNRKCAV